MHVYLYLQAILWRITARQIYVSYELYILVVDNDHYYVLGDPNILDTLVDGVSAEATCIGQNVTYICTVFADTHAWISPSYDQIVLISAINQDVINLWPGFRMKLMAHDGTSITSSASVHVTTALNDTFISCTDGGITSGAQQMITARVLGKLHDT